MDVKVTSMSQVDFTQWKMPMIAIYRNPSDYPRRCVARVYDTDVPTPVVMIGDTVEELEADIKANTRKMIRAPRGADDVKELVCVWW